MVGTWSGDP